MITQKKSEIDNRKMEKKITEAELLLELRAFKLFNKYV